MVLLLHEIQYFEVVSYYEEHCSVTKKQQRQDYSEKSQC